MSAKSAKKQIDKNIKQNVPNNKNNKKSTHPSINDEFSESDHGYTESDEMIEEKPKIVKKIKKNVNKDTNQHVDENEEINPAENTVIEDSFLEKIIKYVKIDNLIRKETVEYKEKINTLKEDKTEMEKYILRYLDTADQKVIQIADSGKLTKYESVRKSGLNKDIIKQSIIDQIKKEKLLNDDAKLNALAELTCQLMESKREVTTKTVLKRTFEKKNKKNGDKN